MKYVILSLVFTFSILKCTAQSQIVENKFERKMIEYKVFDSLENFLSKVIEVQLIKHKHIFIMIDPICLEGMESPNTYLLSTVPYDDLWGYSTLEFVLNNTNRVINIKGKQYPVYFESIEMQLLNPLRNEDDWKVKNYEVDFYRRISIEVDFDNRTFYLR